MDKMISLGAEHLIADIQNGCLDQKIQTRLKVSEATKNAFAAWMTARVVGYRGPQMIDLNLSVNNVSYSLKVDPRTSLLDLIREHLNLTGAKKGCNSGECGACTLHLDGKQVSACMVLALQCEARNVVTIEGLSRSLVLHPVQQAFIDHDALQCGFCTPGQVMAAVACIEEGRAKSVEDVQEWMSGNLCRCSAYPQIVAAVLAASELMAKTGEP